MNDSETKLPGKQDLDVQIKLFLEGIMVPAEEELKSRYENDWKDEPEMLQTAYQEYIPKELEKERGFCKAVITAYDRWNREIKPLVLWDVDDNIGRYSLSTTNGDKWYFRPSFIPLMTYLLKQYPNVRNGILSSRDKSHTQEQLKPGGMLSAMIPFIDPNRIYSTRDIYKNLGQDERDQLYIEITQKLPDLTSPYPGDAHKLKGIRTFQNEGLNVKLIDDFRVADFLANDGVCTQKYRPRGV